MYQEPNLKLQYIKELSQIWYEHQISEEEPVKIEEKFYTLIERIVDAIKSGKIEVSDAEVIADMLERRDRKLLIERLSQVFLGNRDVVTLLEKQCLELVKTTG